jgi:hypothetical protein
MSRTKRIVTIIPALLLLIVIAPNWWSSPEDYGPTPVVLGFLSAMLLLAYLVHFAAPELLASMIVTTPALYLIFHTLCGSTVMEAYLLVARCALALALYFLISSIIDTHTPGLAASILRLLAALCIPFLWIFVFMRQNILFSLSLTILVGLFWFYRRSFKNRG